MTGTESERCRRKGARVGSFRLLMRDEVGVERERERELARLPGDKTIGAALFGGQGSVKKGRDIERGWERRHRGHYIFGFIRATR